MYFGWFQVTAGVIGTTKLLYDIWGDTVNIASRMYSTGVHQRIQVTEDVALKLEPKFDFEYRGQTYVKGKGDMNTYLLKGKKPGATWDWAFELTVWLSDELRKISAKI